MMKKCLKMNNKLLNEDIKNIKYLFGYKPGKVISEQDIDYNNEIGENDTTESILKKYNLFDEMTVFHPKGFIIKNKSSEIIKKLISILPLLKDIFVFHIVDCEYADFSDINVCDLPQLEWINLTGTDNNIDELGYECLEDLTNNFYYLNNKPPTEK